MSTRRRLPVILLLLVLPALGCHKVGSMDGGMHEAAIVPRPAKIERTEGETHQENRSTA